MKSKSKFLFTKKEKEIIADSLFSPRLMVTVGMGTIATTMAFFYGWAFGLAVLGMTLMCIYSVQKTFKLSDEELLMELGVSPAKKLASIMEGDVLNTEEGKVFTDAVHRILNNYISLKSLIYRIFGDDDHRKDVPLRTQLFEISRDSDKWVDATIRLYKKASELISSGLVDTDKESYVKYLNKMDKKFKKTEETLLNLKGKIAKSLVMEQDSSIYAEMDRDIDSIDKVLEIQEYVNDEVENTIPL